MGPRRSALTDLLRQIRRRTRRFTRSFRLPGARFVFHPAYSVAQLGVLDGRRGERVLSYLTSEGALDASEVLVPSILSPRDALLVHSPQYLERLDEPETLASMFPLIDDPGRARELVRAARWAAGGTVFASEWALSHPFLTTPIINLGGGFHHARAASGSGFCAVADVAIAIAALRQKGFAERVLIIDLDLHQGDGNRALFADDPTVFTYSIHVEDLSKGPAAMNLDVQLAPGTSDATYLRTLRETLDEAFLRAKPGLVFYLAGADVAASDAIGTYRLTDDAVARRDRRVLHTRTGIPTVVCLAGGYGGSAWRHPARTALWLLTGEDQPIERDDEARLATFRTIQGSLSPRSLATLDTPADSTRNFGISEADITSDLVVKSKSPGFLGFYSKYGLELVAERYGLLEHLRSRGYPLPHVEPEAERAGRHSLRFFADASKKELLIELVLEEVASEGFRYLSIEWLLLQDPRRQGDILPGQKHPGLGALDIIVGMLVMAAERLGLDGLSLVPAQFHVARRARKLFRFESADAEARFLVLSQAVTHLDRAAAAKAVADKRVVHRVSRAPLLYVPARMVLPISSKLQARLDADTFAMEVEALARGYEVELV